MDIIIHILIFIFGGVIGSFLNVLIFRHNTGESVVYSGSRCLHCGKRLKWPELIPILSFLIQRGRCRHCGSKISWQYPIVEFLTGLVFVLIFWKISNYSLLITSYWLLVFSLFIIIAVYDVRHQIIPNKIVYFLIFLAFSWWLLIDRSFFDFFGGLVFFGLFWLFWFVSSGRWMGLGDAKMALAIGWLLGAFNGFMAILLAFWIGALTGVFLLLFASKKFKMESRIPFGPFLSLGALIAFLFGNNILQIYLNIIGRI